MGPKLPSSPSQPRRRNEPAPAPWIRAHAQHHPPHPATHHLPGSFPPPTPPPPKQTLSRSLANSQVLTDGVWFAPLLAHKLASAERVAGPGELGRRCRGRGRVPATRPGPGLMDELGRGWRVVISRGTGTNERQRRGFGATGWLPFFFSWLLGKGGDAGRTEGRLVGGGWDNGMDGSWTSWVGGGELRSCGREAGESFGPAVVRARVGLMTATPSSLVQSVGIGTCGKNYELERTTRPIVVAWLCRADTFFLEGEFEAKMELLGHSQRGWRRARLSDVNCHPSRRCRSFQKLSTGASINVDGISIEAAQTFWRSGYFEEPGRSSCQHGPEEGVCQVRV